MCVLPSLLVSDPNSLQTEAVSQTRGLSPTSFETLKTMTRLSDTLIETLSPSDTMAPCYLKTYKFSYFM